MIEARKIIRSVAYITLTFLGGIIAGCEDDIDINRGQIPENPEETVSFDLPGYLPVNLRSGELTRADDTYFEENGGDNLKDAEFKAAERAEFALAPSIENEAYHYLLIYENTTGTVKPLVLPLVTSQLTHDDASDPTGSEPEDPNIKKDLTLAVKRVYASADLAQKAQKNFNTVENFKNYLSGATIYALINFKKEQVVAPSGSTTTEDYLSNLTETGLKSLQLSDYKMEATSIDGSKKNYFTMTSCIYKGSNAVSPATDFISGNVYYTEEEAVEGQPAIRALVERLAVKYQLTITRDDNNTRNVKIVGNNKVKVFRAITNDGTFQISTQEEEWRARVVGYGVNALEPSEYLIKHIGTSDYFSGWNAPAKTRSYWGEDSHYAINANNKASYPHQYREALETDSIRAHQTLMAENKNVLNYISYSRLNETPEYFYSLENTYADSPEFKYVNEYNSYSPVGIGPNNFYSAGTHFLLACVLQVGTSTIDRDIYRDEADIYYTSKRNLLNAKLTLLNDRDLAGGASDMYILNVNWEKHDDPENKYTKDLRIYQWEAGMKLYCDNHLATADDLDLIPAEITGGDGKVMIAPAAGKESSFSLRKTVAGADGMARADIQNISYNELVSLFHKTMGTIDYYAGGRMYYCCPVTHNVKSISNLSWKTVGDVGAVRNNWHHIKVSGVRFPGTSVAVAGQPIIPMLDIRRDYISAEVIIYNWHEINSPVTQYPTLQ